MERTCRLIEDADVTLDDGSDYTNAVLRNCRVTYNGSHMCIEGALFLGCAFAFGGTATGMQRLETAFRRSLYAEGYRSLVLDKDGGYVAV